LGGDCERVQKRVGDGGAVVDPRDDAEDAVIDEAVAVLEQPHAVGCEAEHELPLPACLDGFTDPG
jgi:hypothetical protein